MKFLINKWRKAEHKWDESATMFAACDEGSSSIRGIAFGEGSSAAYKNCADMLEAALKAKEEKLTSTNKKSEKCPKCGKSDKVRMLINESPIVGWECERCNLNFD